MALQTSAAGRAVLVDREGCRLKAYRDSVGVWTVGVGHTGRASPPPVGAGTTITRGEAERIFAADLAPFEAAVNRALSVTVSQGQFDALVSLAFNIGAGGFAGSTVVHKLNAGDLAGAADAFLMWSHPPELRRRRVAERAQFLSAAPRLAGSAAPPAGADVSVAPTATPAPGRPPVRALNWLERLWVALTFRKAA